MAVQGFDSQICPSPVAAAPVDYGQILPVQGQHTSVSLVCPLMVLSHHDLAARQCASRQISDEGFGGALTVDEGQAVIFDLVCCLNSEYVAFFQRPFGKIREGPDTPQAFGDKTFQLLS